MCDAHLLDCVGSCVRVWAPHAVVESLEMAWEESGLRFGFILLRFAERDPRAVMMVLDLTCTEITARFHTPNTLEHWRRALTQNTL